jgi:uncharacterized small protein (DUF1192 family)
VAKGTTTYRIQSQSKKQKLLHVVQEASAAPTSTPTSMPTLTPAQAHTSHPTGAELMMGLSAAELTVRFKAATAEIARLKQLPDRRGESSASDAGNKGCPPDQDVPS